MSYDKVMQERQHLIAENESLRSRLRDVVNSPLSDAEKQQIIDDSQQRLHSSAPASIAIPNVCSIMSLFHRGIFVSNCLIQDIICAYRAMEKDYLVCQLLIGTNIRPAAKYRSPVYKTKSYR